jgi:hypothetical protein
MMEHRWDVRIAVPVSVVVHTDDGELLMSTTQNISRGGMVIEAEELKTLVDKKVVWVEFMDDDIVAKVPSYVLRCTEGTAALMFITHPESLHAYLNSLLWKERIPH